MKNQNILAFTSRGALQLSKQENKWWLLQQTYACQGMRTGNGCSTTIGVTIHTDESQWTCDLHNSLQNKYIEMGQGLKIPPVAKCDTAVDSDTNRFQSLTPLEKVQIFQGDTFPKTNMNTLENFVVDIKGGDVGPLMVQALWAAKLFQAVQMSHNDMSIANWLVNGKHGADIRLQSLNPQQAEKCEEHKSTFTLPAERAQAPPERLHPDWLVIDGLRVRDNAPCGATDIWSLGVLMVDLITHNQFRNALKFLHSRHLDNSDMAAFKTTQAYIDLANSQNKFGFIKNVLKQQEREVSSNLTSAVKLKVDNAIDLMKKTSIHSDSNMQILLSSLLNPDPTLRATVDIALENAYIKSILKKIKMQDK